MPAVAAMLTLLLVGLLVYGMLKGGDDTTLDDAVKRGERPSAPGQNIALENLRGGGTTTLRSLRGQVVVPYFRPAGSDPSRGDRSRRETLDGQ